MLYKIVAASAIVAVASAAPTFDHQLQRTPVAGATNALCDACVAAEDGLVTAISSHVASAEAVVKAANFETAAINAHSTGEGELTTANGVADDKKTACQAIISACSTDEETNQPAAIMDRTSPLNLAASNWLESMGVVTSETARIAGLLSDARTATEARIAAESVEIGRASCRERV